MATDWETLLGGRKEEEVEEEGAGGEDIVFVQELI
jgi:hypothetical protein